VQGHFTDFTQLRLHCGRNRTGANTGGRGIGGQTSTQMLARFTADGCHPDPDTYFIMEELVLKAIGEALK